MNWDADLVHYTEYGIYANLWMDNSIFISILFFWIDRNKRKVLSCICPAELNFDKVKLCSLKFQIIFQKDPQS